MAFTMANEGRYWMVTKTPSPVRPTDPDDITSYTYLDLYKNDAYPNRETEVLYNNADFKGYEPAYPLPPPPPTPLAPTQLKFFHSVIGDGYSYIYADGLYAVTYKGRYIDGLGYTYDSLQVGELSNTIYGMYAVNPNYPGNVYAARQPVPENMSTNGDREICSVIIYCTGDPTIESDSTLLFNDSMTTAWLDTVIKPSPSTAACFVWLYSKNITPDKTDTLETYTASQDDYYGVEGRSFFPGSAYTDVEPTKHVASNTSDYMTWDAEAGVDRVIYGYFVTSGIIGGSPATPSGSLIGADRCWPSGISFNTSGDPGTQNTISFAIKVKLWSLCQTSG